MNNNHKLAALDIGTNSFHLIVISTTSAGEFNIIDKEREVIRLSEGNARDTKKIQPEGIERAVETIQRFKKIAELHGAKLRATATSAVREASNRDQFVKNIFKRTGVNIEVIGGIEEARLIYLGIQNAIPILDKTSLAIDIGGGSSEFILGKAGEIEFADSIKIGAVRLTQKFFPDYIVNDQRVEETRNFVKKEISKIAANLSHSEIKLFVGSSGTIMSVGLMIEAMRKDSESDNHILNNYQFSAEELFEIEEIILSKRRPEERKVIPGLEEGRADIIPAGIIIISTIFKELKIKEMIISGYALREGIILDSMDKLGIC